MKISICILATVAVASTTSMGFTDVLEIDLGDFRFGSGTDAYEYEGGYEHLLGSDIEGVNHLRTVATVDLRGLMSMFPGQSISWISVTDSGNNSYNPHMDPGADIDVFSVTGLPSYVDSVYSYAGPNDRYWDSTSDQLAEEVAVVDVDYGGGDAAPWWVSLGEQGSLTMSFDGWMPPHYDGDSDDSGGADDGDAGDPGSDVDAGDTGDVDDRGDDGGAILDVLDELGSADGEDGMLDGMILRDLDLFADMFLRLNEVSPTPEWITITIGLEAAMGPVVVPGPGAAMAVACSLGLMRRRRR